MNSSSAPKKMKKPWWKSLRIKIIAWSFVPTAIILSAVAWFTYYSYQKVLGDLAIKQYPMIVQTEVQETSVALQVVGNTYLVPIFKEVDTDLEAPPEVRAQKILDYSMNLGVFDGGIFFVNQQGIIFKTQPGYTELLGEDWSDTPHFRSINKTPNYAAWTDLIPIESSGKKIFCIGFAMTGLTWDEFLGAGYYCFNIYPFVQNAYYEAISQTDPGPNYYILDRNQQVIYSSEPADMGKDLSGEAYIQQLSQGKSKSGRFQVGNRDMVVGYVPLSASPETMG